ncbi:MAG: hypothetical protein GF320_00510 [Armatimonadia bacterium]|nr:hypothetical protein [Armatimonadia bacterium]
MTESAEGLEQLRVKNRELAEDIQRYLTVFHRHPHPTFYLDCQGELAGMSEQAVHDFLGDSGQAQGPHALDRLGWLREAVESLPQGSDATMRREQRLMTTSGPRTFVVAVSRAVDVSGQPMGLVVALTDVTDLRAAEDEAERANRRLEQSNQDMRDFTYAASHDLQEPIRKIISFLELLKREIGPDMGEEARSYFHYVEDAAHRMRQLVHALLDLCRVESRGGRMAMVDSTVALEQALASLEMLMEETDAVVSHGDLPMVKADLTQLSMVFANLLGNAIKYRGDEPPRIDVEAESANGEWTFCVTDNGIGIPEGQEEVVFDVFRRLHGRGEYPGTGIGLAIVRRIVVRHGGRVWVESTPGEGSKFYFSLPEADADGPE